MKFPQLEELAFRTIISVFPGTLSSQGRSRLRADLVAIDVQCGSMRSTWSNTKAHVLIGAKVHGATRTPVLRNFSGNALRTHPQRSSGTIGDQVTKW